MLWLPVKSIPKIPLAGLGCAKGLKLNKAQTFEFLTFEMSIHANRSQTSRNLPED
jgi:hypothetical protein